MSTVNYNDTAPAPPTGMTNIKWQSDASGNISAYDPGQGWQAWTPTVSPQGGMTISGVTITYARYLRIGSLVFFQFRIAGTIAGTLSNVIFVSLPPITPVAPAAQLGLCQPFQGTLAAVGAASITATEIQCNASSGNFVVGSLTLFSSGFYGCV